MVTWMAKAATNGWVKLIVGIAATLAIAWGGYAVSKLDALEDKVDVHANKPGHPVMVERIKALESKVDAIGSDVKELLRRTP